MINDVLDIALFLGVLCLIPVALLIVGALGWGVMAGVRSGRAARLAEQQTKQTMAIEAARAVVEIERAKLDLALVQPVNGVLPMPRALLESGVMAEGVLHLAMQHVLNGRPLQPVPQTLTYSPHYSNKQDLASLNQPEAAQLALASTSTKDFWQLWQDGSMPNDKFLMGYDMETGKPIHAGWKALYSALIGGQSGSGKSTLIRNILAQSALQGGRFVVIDPHYGAGEESLGASLLPLRGRMVCDVASNDRQMIEALRFVADVGKRRLAGQDSDKSPLILVVDETTGLLSRGAVADDLQNVLGQISQETRKVGVFALCIGQQFHSSFFDTTVRNSFVSQLSCRARRDVARTQSGNTEFGRVAETLTTGQCVWMTPAGEMWRVAVPNTTQQHIEMVATHLNLRENSADNAQGSLTPVEANDPANDLTHDKANDMLAKIEPTAMPYHGVGYDAFDIRIRELFLTGASVGDIAVEVFNVKKTAGNPYVTACNNVQNALRKFMN